MPICKFGSIRNYLQFLIFLPFPRNTDGGYDKSQTPVGAGIEDCNWTSYWTSCRGFLGVLVEKWDPVTLFTKAYCWIQGIDLFV